MRDAAGAHFKNLFGPEFGHGKVLGLDALRAALGTLGNPQERLPPVIHVAGTNGKGSTIAFMRAIAKAAGLRAHAFTKPHLFALNERFVVGNEVVSDAALIAAADRVARLAPGLTQFDAQVAAAFVLFSEAPADLVLLETGMGGRDDSTNVIARPALTIITPIGLDHQDALGATLKDIAMHKAGILKPAVAAVVARQPNEARAVIEAKAADIDAPLLRQGVEWDAHANAGRLVVQTETRALDLPLPALQGAHQIDNAGLAAVALMHLRELSDDAFAAGVTSVRWPARLQPLTRGALSAPIRAIGGEVWVDGGHNGHALAALLNWHVAQQRIRRAPLVVIFGSRARKDWANAIKVLAQAAERFIVAPIADGADPEAIARHAQNEGTGAAFAAPSLLAAMQNAAQLRAPRVLICGSFLLAAEALAAERS